MLSEWPSTITFSRLPRQLSAAQNLGQRGRMRSEKRLALRFELRLIRFERHEPVGNVDDDHVPVELNILAAEPLGAELPFEVF